MQSAVNMKGQVRTDELNMKSIYAGTVAILNNKNTFEIVTVQHIDSDGNWVVMGNQPDAYKVPIEAQLCRLVVTDASGTYPLKFNQWANAIRGKEINSDKIVEFELVPAKFKDGKHIRVCDTCTAHFLASRTQGTCKTCCNLDVTAKILINKTVKQEEPQMISLSQARRFAILAYGLGKTGSSSDYFDEWLEKHMSCQ